MQRFAVNVTNPISIPDVLTKRRDASEHDEMDERLDERERVERQHHASTSSIERERETRTLTTPDGSHDHKY